jgi:hypothetical protein
MPAFRTDPVVFRTHHGGDRFLRHSGVGVLFDSPGSTVSRVHRRRETSVTPSPEHATPVRNPESDDRIAVVMEQDRDHAEAYLPGMGRAQHITHVTPDGALKYLLQLLH